MINVNRPYKTDIITIYNQTGSSATAEKPRDSFVLNGMLLAETKLCIEFEFASFSGCRNM